jgi:hypothetical protein
VYDDIGDGGDDVVVGVDRYSHDLKYASEWWSVSRKRE